MSMQDAFFYMTGMGFLALAKAKNILQGYSSPKPFSVSEAEKCIEYDMRVVDSWLHRLGEYTHGVCSVAGKSILELGPGSDLGIGIYLLSKGCSQYNACDVNDLMLSTPDSFYEKFFLKIKSTDNRADIDLLKSQLAKTKKGDSSRLNYVVRKDFDIVSAFGESSVDLVFSQAAFEHFDDIEAVASKVSAVCRPGAILIAEIDLKSHSRWIRDKDPNNIYRYPERVYNIFRFRGSPNRMRPFQYKEAFERRGWSDVSITAVSKLHNDKGGLSGMNRAFADEKHQMDHLSIVLCARKGERTNPACPAVQRTLFPHEEITWKPV
jgi:SAM-dependent methyltransferase